MKLETVVQDQYGERVKQAAADRGTSTMSLMRQGLGRVVREAPPYQFQGFSGESLVRDLATAQGWTPHDETNVDAASDRLARFQRWSQDFQQDTDSASEVVPPGYRQAVTVPRTADRPLASACETASIQNAAPFTVPVAEGDGTVDAARAEGDQPSGADPVFNDASVSPVGLAGNIELSRELVDSASPGGDLVALSVMREDWQRQVEIRLYDALNQAAGQSFESTDPASTLYEDLRARLAAFANVRRRKARNAVAGSEAVGHLASLIDFENGDEAALWRVMGAAVNASVNPFGTGTSDARVLILGSDDVVNFESPLVEFRFDESAGPALVRAAVWGYHAVSVARPSGVSEITFA